jgi:lipid-A-disaccharide synthase
MKKIAIIAGEASGDILGSRLIHALRQLDPAIQFEGIGGEEMENAGCDCLYPMERLAVMGFAEVFSRLPELLNIRRTLVQRWLDNPPDLIIGIDAPDFNLAVEKKLHAVGIPAVHYVSPSVWAWRAKRVKKMQGNLDLMLTLFPFEVDFYQQHGIDAAFVGHPLADEIPLQSDKLKAREQLSLDEHANILAILPGSRSAEIKRLSEPFLKVAERLHKENPDMQFVTPLVSQKTRQQFETLRLHIAPDLPIRLITGKSRQVMQAADTILLASGTAVLEGMLVNRPMLAAYQVAPLTAKIIRFFKMMQVEHFTLPNNLAKEVLVPELIQEEVTVDKLYAGLQVLFNESDEQKNYRQQRFAEIHAELQQKGSQRAADILYRRFLS